MTDSTQHTFKIFFYYHHTNQKTYNHPMSYITKSVLLFAIVASIAYAYTKEEIEMFQFQTELNKKYGSDMNIYKFLKLDKIDSNYKNINNKQIIKQVRKLSAKYHPDKNKKYIKLYQRINIAKDILLNHESRKNYDYYLNSSRGFPKYDFMKGGFYHSLAGRMQLNGILLLLFVLTVVCPFFHVLYLKSTIIGKRMKMNQFIDAIIEQHDDTKGLGVKYLKFDTSEKQDESQIDELCIKFGKVYSVEKDGKEVLMDPSVLIPDMKVSDVFPLNLFFGKKK